MPRAELPPAVWLVPWVGLLVLPSLGTGPVGSRLAVLFAELLLGLPLLVVAPRELRPALMPFPRLSAPWRLACWCLPLPAALLYQGINALSSTWLPLPAALVERTRQALSADGAVEALLIGASLLLVAPVMEELFFRGLLPWLVRRRLGRGVLVLPALLFALSHMNPWLLPQLFLLGLFLGWLRERSASLAPGILVHAAVNLTGLALLHWPAAS